MKLNMANYNLLHESLRNLTLPVDGPAETTGVIRLPTNLDLTKQSGVSFLGTSLQKSKQSRAHQIIHGTQGGMIDPQISDIDENDEILSRSSFMLSSCHDAQED